MRDAPLSNAQARPSSSPSNVTPSPSLALPFAFIAGVVLALVTSFAVRPAPGQTCSASDTAIPRLHHAD